MVFRRARAGRPQREAQIAIELHHPGAFKSRAGRVEREIFELDALLRAGEIGGGTRQPGRSAAHNRVAQGGKQIDLAQHRTRDGCAALAIERREQIRASSSMRARKRSFTGGRTVEEARERRGSIGNRREVHARKVEIHLVGGRRIEMRGERAPDRATTQLRNGIFQVQRAAIDSQISIQMVERERV